MALAAGTRLGVHEVISLIGEGGMGQVYLAQDTKLNRRVAIKILPEAYATDAERVARFHREAQAIAALNHPGIGAIHDFAEAGAGAATLHYLVLELVDGETLADRLRRGALPVDEALNMARQIAEAVQAAHDKGICHRDLKPANVKITSDGIVKVLDFGLAKFLEARTSSSPGLTHSPTLSLAGTLPGVVLGTAGYMSPEQAKGLEADQRSDVFSFGCILFEMLTGQQVFHGETVSEILASVLKTEPDFSQLPSRLNPRLVETLKRCLEKNPKRRWQAIGDVRLDIEALADRAIVSNSPPAAGVDRWASLKWIAALALGLVAGAAVAGYGAWRLRPAPVHQVTRFSLTLDTQLLTGNSRKTLAIAPDGQGLVYVANVRLYLRTMSAFGDAPIAGTDGMQAIVSPVFSPDGKSIVFIADGRTFRRVPTTGGTAVTICELEGQPYGLTWDPSGILFGQIGKGIMRASPNGGAPEVLVSVAPGELASNPQMLPGGKAVVFALKKQFEAWDRGQIVVQSLGGERKTIVSAGSDVAYVPTGHLVYASGGTLFAVPFDLDRLMVSGAPLPVVEGVRRALGGSAADGTGTVQFAVSSSGTLAYLPGPVGAESDQFDLALFDRRGGIQRLKLPPGPHVYPRATRDGRWIAFERADARETSIWTYELESTRAPQRITFGGNNNKAPVWSPDGLWIAFTSDRDGNLAIFRQRADGASAPERLTKPDAGLEHAPQGWSADGGTLLFSAQKGTESRLWTLSLKDRQITPFGDANAREASFSPDGSWVAYQTRSTDGTRNAIYLEPFPRTGAKYLVPFDGPVGHPFWSANGDEIIVNARSNVSQSVKLTTKPAVTFERPQPFSRQGRQEGNPATTRRNVDMLPDNERVVGALFPGSVGDPGELSRINVVLNWFDELRERVPVSR